MKLTKLSALCFAAASMTATSSAVLAEGSAWETSGSVALSTEYNWRGVSQTDNSPALSGSLDIAHESGFYAGTWASNIENSEGSLEIDYYAGYGADIGDSGFSYDVGALYYDFPSIEDFDYFELYAFLSYSYFSAGVSYSIDAFDADWDGAEDNIYYQLDASFPVGMFSLNAGVAYWDFDDDSVWGVDDYTNYYVGISTEYAGFGFDLTYADTDNDGEDFSGVDNDTFVFTISKSL